jgi:hypothetical protein
MNHIFFGCTTAKYVWSLIAYATRAICRPSNFGQYWAWIKISLPNGNPTYVMGLAAIYWAI